MFKDAGYHQPDDQYLIPHHPPLFQPQDYPSDPLPHARLFPSHPTMPQYRREVRHMPYPPSNYLQLPSVRDISQQPSEIQSSSAEPPQLSRGTLDISGSTSIPQSSAFRAFLADAEFVPLTLPPPPIDTTAVSTCPHVKIVPPTPAAVAKGPSFVDDVFSNNARTESRSLPASSFISDNEDGPNGGVEESPTFGRLSKEKRQALDDGYKRMDEVVKEISLQTGLPVQLVINRWNRASTRKKNRWNIYQKYFRAHLHQEMMRLSPKSQTNCTFNFSSCLTFTTRDIPLFSERTDTARHSQTRLSDIPKCLCRSCR